MVVIEWLGISEGALCFIVSAVLVSTLAVVWWLADDDLDAAA